MTRQVHLLGRAQASSGSRSFSFLADGRYHLLAYLAYQQAWVSREQVQYLFWSEHSDKQAKDNLRQLLRRVRALKLEPDLASDLVIERQRLRWHVETDTRTFSDAVDKEQWDLSLRHYGGPFLQGLEPRENSEFVTWLGLERDRLHASWRLALLKQAERLTTQGQYLEATTLLSQLLGDDLDEEALTRYMQAALQAGGRDQALKAYEAFAERLREELDLAPTSALEQLAQQIHAGTYSEPAHSGLGSSPAPTHPTITTPSTSTEPDTSPATDAPRVLPTLTTSFIGRDLELAEVAALLAAPECRLLTLTGLGGTGKTRVALQTASLLAPNYKGGVCFVSLASLSSATLLPAHIAEHLHSSLQGVTDPAEQVADLIGRKELLLVLDNFEHLLAGAELVEVLVRACPRLDVLVTSRERLNVEAEWLLPLGGLSYPQVEPIDLAEALRFDAPQLFLQRARRVKPDFSVSRGELAHLLSICRQVEGSPLGLELAAVWVRLMPLAEIAAELGRSTDFLDANSRTKVARHQSLRAVFEHSWELLTLREQAMLRKLSVFVGGFSREAAKQVTGASLPVLAALVDKSLLRVSPDGRYSRHTLVYAYAREKLDERPDERAQVEEAHGSYFLQRLVDQWSAQRGADAQAAFTAIDRDWDNVRVAWRWAARELKVSRIKRATFPLTLYFHRRMRYQEAFETFNYAAAVLTESERAHVGALAGVLTEQAWHAFRLGRFLVAKHLAERGLSLARTTKDNESLMAALNALGCFANHVGAYQEALALLQEALSLPKPEHLPLFQAELLGNVAMVEKALGNYDRVKRHASDLLAFYRRHGNRVDVVFYFELMGEVHLHQGGLDKAEASIREGLQQAREHEASFIVTRLLVLLARVAYDSGAYAEAQAHCQEALALVQARGGHSHEISDLKNTLGRLATARGDTATALDLLGQSLGYAWTIQALPRVLDALVYLAELLLEQKRPVPATELLSLARHHPSSKYWLKKLAQRHLETLTGQNLEGLKQAQTRGKALELAEFVPKLLAEWSQFSSQLTLPERRLDT